MFAIACADQNFAIGRGNELLYHISEDLKRFKALTLGKTVVMGRATLESMPGGKPLINRQNIVLSRNEGYVIPQAEGRTAVLLTSVEKVLVYLSEGCKTDDVAIIGGETVYRQFLPYCDTVYLTVVCDHFKGADKFFPDLSAMPEWKIAESSDIFDANGLKYRYVTYKKQQ